MKLISNSFGNNDQIPGEHAFCVPDAQTHVSLGANRNPHLAWSDLPPGTRSLVLICHDPDVPSRGDDVNQEGRVVPADLPRVDFFHWVLVDLPPAPAEIAAGEFCGQVTPRGKVATDSRRGTRHGINDYTGWFAGDKDMGGDYYGYDGPCPPWNDSIAHRYLFTLYALGVEHCPVDGAFRGPELLEAIKPHVLGSAKLTGSYSLNPAVKA